MPVIKDLHFWSVLPLYLYRKLFFSKTPVNENRIRIIENPTFLAVLNIAKFLFWNTRYCAVGRLYL